MVLFLASTASDLAHAHANNSLVVVHISFRGSAAFWHGERVDCVDISEGEPKIVSAYGSHSSYTLRFAISPAVLLNVSAQGITYQAQPLTIHRFTSMFVDYNRGDNTIAF
jgi:hypothetical protein